MIELEDSTMVFEDTKFRNENTGDADAWQRIAELYPQGANLSSVLPDKFSREQFEQGDHFECFMLTALSVLVNHPEAIRNCFVTKKPRKDGRYVFQFFRFDKWHEVEIDDTIPTVEGDTVFIRSPTKHWWPLLLEKAYAKFYQTYSRVEGCTLQEALHDISGNPVLNIPLDPKLAAAAGAEINDGPYWLDLSKKIRTGQLGVTSLSKRELPTSFGMRDEQTYGVQEIVTIGTTTEIVNLLVHLYSPFEEDVYTGPMKEDDPLWTAPLKAQYNPSRKNSIFLPLLEFLRIFNSLQIVYLKMVDPSESATFADEWVAGGTAGGNPTFVSWRHNPMYLVRNSGTSPLTIVAEIRQEDQRALHDPEGDQLKYIQCGLVLSQANFPSPVPTKYVTGNNHKSVHKGLFLNSREVANTIVIPPSSLCYLVPTAMQKSAGKFTLGVYYLKGVEYGNLKIQKVDTTHLAWQQPAMDELEVMPKSKDRVDFYVDEGTEIHILLTQQKPFTSKSGADNMTEDFCGMYLYNDTDKKIAGVSAATNFRETSLIHHLPSSGRYALSITCPKGTGAVPVVVTIVGSAASKVRIVDPPEDAKDLADEDDDDDNDDQQLIDFEPRTYPMPVAPDVPDGDTKFEDRQFFMDNRDVTDQRWMHITDLYPEGKAQPLLPDTFSIDHFEQGDHFECFMLTALSVLVNHPITLRKCFVTTTVRRDGRYVFRFFRYGQWNLVEIDDRIPVVEGNDTLYLRSPTKHWWPLLLEKAMAKFYNRYANIEGCTLQEALQDLTGNPVLNVPFEEKLALAAGHDIADPQHWIDLSDDLQNMACTALTRRDIAASFGMRDEQTYGFLGITRMHPEADISMTNLLVKLYCPFVEDVYTGPMNVQDLQWTAPLLATCTPTRKGIIYMILEDFLRVFASMHICHIHDIVGRPCSSFHSMWDNSCSGGSPIYTTWRENPLYVVHNKADDPIDVAFVIRQPDQRSTMHVRDEEPRYIQCGMVLTQSSYKQPFPTHLVTSNNHRATHKGLFLNSREVANVVTIPANSLCYMVPAPMQKGIVGRFMLSYHFMYPGDDQYVSVWRHKSKMALDRPATDEFELVPRSKDRVDFEVDCSTEVHILLTQLKPHTMKSGGDSMTEDYCGLYLYNDQNKRITGVSAATNYRDTGLLYVVPNKGRYAISVTCPKGTGRIPVRVSIVATGPANVRIVDPPDDAEDFEEVDLSFLDQEPEGVPLDDLDADEDEEFKRMVEHLKKLLKNADANRTAIEKHEREMNIYVHILAKRYIARERPKFLKIPNGYDANTIGPLLDEDDKFTSKEVVRYGLKKDPRNASKVKAAEKELNERATIIATENENVEADRSFVDPVVRGVPIELLPLNSDAELQELDKKLRDARRRNASAGEIRELEDAIRRRIVVIAEAYVAQHRRKLVQAPRGVSLSTLPLDNDKKFAELEQARYRLMQDPVANGAEIASLEAQLNQRALELASDVLANDRNYLDPKPEGVLLILLMVDADPKFRALEEERQALKSDPAKNAAKIREKEALLNERARELALAYKKQGRGKLRKFYWGIPVDDLPLDSDAEMKALEEERRQLTDDDPTVAELEQRMDERAAQLAEEMHDRERALLDQEPDGIPLGDLPLNENKMFIDAENQLRQLRKDPKRNGAKIKEQEAVVAKLLQGVARNEVEKGREFLNQEPRGIPLNQLSHNDDEIFRNLERELRKRRIKYGKVDAPEIAAIEDQMNERVEEIADEYIKNDRVYLHKEPEGVPIESVPVDGDSAFRALEVERSKFKAAKNAKLLQDAENKLNERSKEIAREMLRIERQDFNPEPAGIALEHVIPIAHEDKRFRQLENQRRKKNRADDEWGVLTGEAGTRIEELALECLRAERGFLQKDPEGVPLSELPLDRDEAFHALEVERFEAIKSKKKDTRKLVELEAALNNRAKELARQHLEADMGAYLDPEPRGVLLSELPLSTDKAFQELQKERTRLKKDKKNQQKVVELEKKQNARCSELALEALHKDRSAFLDKAPRGIPLQDLQLDNHPEYVELERKRWRMKRKGRTDDAEVQLVEDDLVELVDEIADEVLRTERAFLDPEPEGVPLEFLPYEKDRAFSDLEHQRRQLARPDERAKHKKAIGEIEDKMNERNRELAREHLARDRGYLEPEPEGIPHGELPLNTDKQFRALETKRQQLKRDPEKNREAIEDAEYSLNERARELAMSLFEKDRAYLDPEPEGVPLSNLPLNTDKPFRTDEIARRKNKRGATADVEGRLNARACVLAREYLNNDRAYLEPEPEGVLLEYLPLNTDGEFREMEKQRGRLKKNGPQSSEAVEDLEDRLNDRAAALARDLIKKERSKFLKPEYAAVPTEYLPLDHDSAFRDLEKRRRAADKRKGKGDGNDVRVLEDDLNDRALELAHDFLAEERAFLSPEPEGIPLAELPLNTDKPFRDWELERRKLRRDPKKFGPKVDDLEGKMKDRTHELAKALIQDDRSYLNPEPHGVPLEFLPLDTDPQFQRLEADRRNEKKQNGKPMKIKGLEDDLNDRAHVLAKEFLAKEREYLDPMPEGIPIAEVNVDGDKPFRALELERRKLRVDPKNQRKVQDLEDRLNERARQLAREMRGFQDEDFHARNAPAADNWVRVSDLYPEGQRDSILPERPSGADVESAPDGAGFLAPFLAALTRNFPLYHALVDTKVPRKREPFVFQFHSPTTGPTKVHIDDRIPVGKDGLPAFTRSPNRRWYPMLIEKAYAKFRGGYKKLDHVTPHEVLRDLTGKPVTHIPLEKKLARASGIDPTSPKYWRSLRDDIARGDIVTAMSLWEAPDGIHRQSSYAIMTVVDTLEGSDDPNDTFVRLHNSYRYAPYYNGPFHRDDKQWTRELLQICKYDKSRDDTLFLPLPVFIRNFVSLQRCHSNGGDPISHTGEWDARTSGGNPNSTAFRNNPVFLLENRGSRPAPVVVELRHHAPLGIEALATSEDDADDDSRTPGGRSKKARRTSNAPADEEACAYPQTGIIVMVATTPITVPTNLLALNGFRPLFKSIILDSRELATSFHVPPTTTCFVIPFTLRRGVLGAFDISLYPFQGMFHFFPYVPPVYMPKPLVGEVTVAAEHDGPGQRMDFLLDDHSELHILIQQTMPYDSGKRGDLHASNLIQGTLFDEGDIKVAYTGEPSDYREQVILTRPVPPGRYALLLLAPKGHPEQFPVTVYVYASKKGNLRWTPLPPNARPLIQSRFPMLPKSAPTHKVKDHDVDGAETGDRRNSYPMGEIHHGEVEIFSSKVPKEKIFEALPVPPPKPKPKPRKSLGFGTGTPRSLMW